MYCAKLVMVKQPKQFRGKHRVEELHTAEAGEKRHDPTALHELPEEHWRQHWCLDSTYLGAIRCEHSSSDLTLVQLPSRCFPLDVPQTRALVLPCLWGELLEEL